MWGFGYSKRAQACKRIISTDSSYVNCCRPPTPNMLSSWKQRDDARRDAHRSIKTSGYQVSWAFGFMIMHIQHQTLSCRYQVIFQCLIVPNYNYVLISNILVSIFLKLKMIATIIYSLDTNLFFTVLRIGRERPWVV